MGLGIGKLLGGGIGSVVEKVAGVFTPNKEAQSQRDAAATAQASSQYAAEFNVHANRTLFDSFVDGANRLVRPIMAYSVLAFFGVVIYDVDRGLEVSQSLATVPMGMWTLLSIIVTFYFGSRHVLKGKEFEVTKKQIEASSRIGELRKEAATTVSADEYVRAMNDDSKKLTNKVILEWNKQSAANQG